MTSKDEALKRLTALETEAAELRKILETPEPVEKKALITFEPADLFLFSHELSPQAKAYAEALNTLLDLRRQPGSEAEVDGKRQWTINPMGEAESVVSTAWKLERICPMFDSKESALAAKEAVVWDRIERMMNTLHGRTE